MQAGKLRHLITIQNIVSTQDVDTGVVTNTPELFATVWADIRPMSAREYVAAGISGSKVTTTITIRYLPGIKPSMRIVAGDRIYNIEGVLPDPKNSSHINLPCSEVQGG